ncbi:Epidermal retinol dehydrogenase 2 [Camelus dromedarius]|uniref:Epidermal retinol dehydrogenase 2 n=1 Tax=Camelus dromedarius TaxID=9838 RepID=A0A5N4CC06_CAMDR|nr:epidermal retinol dehydrogenase 2-like isoform X4 [Camelus dromedarius]KAB1256397.1 Epidermal retinol dehydrogenase 2 [Camelus dromedarius]
MAPSVNTAKELSIFLVKAMFAFLEAAIFALIPKPPKNVAGEIVLITGAGSGLGRLLAVQFAHLGSVLVLWDINEEGNEETRRMAWDAGAMTVHAYTCDCGRKEEVYRVANQTYKAFLPAMIANDHGHLVCISSSAGLIGTNQLADYCASKFAAFGFAESIFLETLAQKQNGIKTTIVCPFFIKTGMFEGCTTSCPFLLPILEPEYAVRKIVDAILQEKMYLYMPKFIYFMVFLKSFLPFKVGILVAEYLRALHFMDSFTGQKKKD